LSRNRPPRNSRDRLRQGNSDQAPIVAAHRRSVNCWTAMTNA
jgi:hypothetical protein